MRHSSSHATPFWREGWVAVWDPGNKYLIERVVPHSKYAHIVICDFRCLDEDSSALWTLCPCDSRNIDGDMEGVITVREPTDAECALIAKMRLLGKE